ncbi:hypothetical protein [Streptomyces sp. NBC_00114]|uniref:hypothetical protein n=1 Tax=Streptomyces sp. NBC_00114 TaxID=2975656 RepID=UPI00386834B6
MAGEAVRGHACVGGQVGDMFDLEGPFRWWRSADEVGQASAASVRGGGFARVVTRKEVVDEVVDAAR